MRVILIRAKATKHLIEYSILTNDDDAIQKANDLRHLDTRNEYLIDILIPEPFDYVMAELMQS